VEPIPESIEVAEALESFLGQRGLIGDLRSVAARVARVVPDCIGLSLAWTEHDVTFTLQASEEEILVFDALQYLTGGPCVDSVVEERVVAADHDDLMSEDGWHLFARTTAARGVMSTLTLPLTEHGEVVGSVNLYGGSTRAFEGHHDELAMILGASAPDAVRNADLSFSTRQKALDSPAALRHERRVDVAVGILAARFDLDLGTARSRLVDAAERAGVPAHLLAELLIDTSD
jgi:GAF domain-containing protein